MAARKTWNIFFDLQCPYSKKCWQNLPGIMERYSDKYEINVHITSLLFHPQAFTAHCASVLVGNKVSAEARKQFQDCCFENQDQYMNAQVGDARKSEIDEIFASIAEKAGILSEKFTKEVFVKSINDWDIAVKPAYEEHKFALQFGVYGTPKHVINGKLVADTESSWDADAWAPVLEKL